MAGMAFAQDKPLSAAFKKEAWKALDAIQRIDFALSKENKDSNKALIGDAENAVNEAKYVATTPSDKQMLFTLQMSLDSLELQGMYDIQDAKFKPYLDRHVQCISEALYYFEPARVTKEGIEKAKLKTCNKKTAEWESGFWK